ncbi:hypothetical protein HY004_02450, partial [Candidatus Saccharibacteria bacterium]|nr:hypothetical protein [Candidatus Saccharibacteria bacterium]
PENSSGAIDARNACQSAFDTSYKYGTISSAKCSSSKNKDACETGASAGKAAKISFTNSVKQTGTDGANNNKSQVDSCSKYHNATNISTCKKAWSAQVIVKAKETAVNAKSADDCKGILGGSKAEKACKEAFTKAKNAADAAGINKCDTVVTYFDFDCGSAKTTSGGRQNPIVSLLLTVLSWVTGLVSMAAIGGIIYGGILYAGAQDNSGQTQKGIMYVVNSTIALLLWFAAFALINYIVPGGLFS